MSNSTSVDLDGVRGSLTRLDTWLERNGWAGYDPYDLLGTPLFLRLQRVTRQSSLVERGTARALLRLERDYPLVMRRAFRVKKQINAKGMGLLASGYLNWFRATGEPRFRAKALECLAWLQANPSVGYHGLSWGYPFDWQSKVFIPKGTPSAVVSSVVGDAFWRAYRLFNDKQYLDVCTRICEFFLADLNVDRLENGSICFSYTPVDDFHVHNANLFAAEFLVRVGKETANAEWVRWGESAANYSLDEQNPDGSLYYWGRVQNDYHPDHRDHYHSGFEIRSLYGIGKWTGEARYVDAARRYYEFYRDNYWARSGSALIPKMTPASTYPIDIHTCAEALLCNTMVSTEWSAASEVLTAVSLWIIENMQTRNGWFIYMIREDGRRVEIPYLRWGQAWMLAGLSAYLLAASGAEHA